MPFEQIAIPDIVTPPGNQSAIIEIIDHANQRIDDYTKSAPSIIHNFVHCDFDLTALTIHWILENNLLTGERFCEWGSGFGVATMLATAAGMDAVGIEIEPILVKHSHQLAGELRIDSRFFCGSFIPHDVTDILEISRDVEHVTIEEDDAYQEIGQELSDFDLVFAFPWPGESDFFEALFLECAATGACLLTYRGREGMHLIRKL